MHWRNNHGRLNAPDQTRSFDGLFRAHHISVRSFVARRVLAAEVEDVVAETFATVWRRRRDLPSDPDFHRAWLLRTANYTVLNQRRSRRRHLALAEKVADDSRSGLQADAGDPYASISAGSGTRIAAGFSSLSPGDQLVLTLVAWDDLSVPELAAALGCSENAATTRLSRARARIRSYVEEGDLVE